MINLLTIMVTLKDNLQLLLFFLLVIVVVGALTKDYTATIKVYLTIALVLYFVGLV